MPRYVLGGWQGKWDVFADLRIRAFGLIETEFFQQFQIDRFLASLIIRVGPFGESAGVIRVPHAAFNNVLHSNLSASLTWLTRQRQMP